MGPFGTRMDGSGGEAGVTEESTAFADAMIFDGVSDELREGCVRVASGTIVEVGEGPEAGDRVIDCRGRTVVPGLIDAHFHAYGASLSLLEIETSPLSYLALAGARRLAGALGVRIGFGTDLMGALDDEQLHGLRLQAEVEGPLALLRAATSVNAELLGRDDLGRIVPSAVADLLVLDGDPLRDPSVLWGDPDRRAVFQGGTRVAEHDARLVLLPGNAARTTGYIMAHA
jgi:imidazolonepropionase-like amidohydrolase